jgi:ABC-type multidrug transport system fused ATPase/permease subunit
MELLDIFETQSDTPKPVSPKWPAEVKGAIEFRNVSFSYPNGTSDALTNINITIKPNEVVAIIGPSGSGKSTFAKLLELAYHATSGEVLVDGVNLKEFDPSRYRREVIGVVTQQPQLFNDSIAENIRIGNLLATDEEVRSAAEAAYSDQFISETAEGYNTVVGENGIRLSGGQKQRLTIARALVRDPKILILDEATSALDCESQKMVQRAIDERIASKSCTTIIIAHRFSTIENADRVIALDKGRVAEVGTHQELARRNGIYARFKQLETEGYLS